MRYIAVLLLMVIDEKLQSELVCFSTMHPRFVFHPTESKIRMSVKLPKFYLKFTDANHYLGNFLINVFLTSAIRCIPIVGLLSALTIVDFVGF